MNMAFTPQNAARRSLRPQNLPHRSAHRYACQSRDRRDCEASPQETRLYFSDLSAMRCLLLVFLLMAAAQVRAQTFRTNFLDTADKTTQDILHVWKSYLFSGPGSTAARRYWDSTEAAQYSDYDFAAKNDCLRGVFDVNDFTVLGIHQRDAGLYEIITLLEDDSTDVVVATSRVMIRQGEDSSFRLQNYLLWATRDWSILQTPHITYHYPDGTVPDTAGAQKSEAFLQSLASDFSIPLRPLQVYVFDDCERLFRLTGLENHFLRPQQKVCGCFEEDNSTIYSGGRGFYYPHELVHVLNRHFPKGHTLLLTGLSGLLGGHFGKPLSWHQPRVLRYMEAHPEKDFNAITDFHQLDEHTNPQYVVFGLFCLEALELGGQEKLKRMLSYGDDEAAFYTAVEKELHLKKRDIATFVMRRLREKDLFVGYNKY